MQFHSFISFPLLIKSLLLNNQIPMDLQMVATGMVVTSQRAVEAMELCVANFVSHEGWSHFINYVSFAFFWYGAKAMTL